MAIFDIDVQGGAQILDRWPGDAISVLVIPPSPGELERRLRGRSTESDEAIRLRLAAARSEVARARLRYGYVIVNDELEDAPGRAPGRLGRRAGARRAGATDPAAAVGWPRPRRMDRADLAALGFLIGRIFFSKGVDTPGQTALESAPHGRNDCRVGQGFRGRARGR